MLPTLLFSIYFLTLPAMSLVQESEVGADFNDLGKLLLGGFAAAIVVALTFTFVKLRLRERKPQVAEVLSINSVDKKQED
ncbi:MAG: hypothetical protein ACRD6N_01350 [Pyrinomonadaceae bacterium]